MSEKVIILGAKGRFGRAAVNAFLTAGWTVRAFARSWDGDMSNTAVEKVSGDAFDADTLTKAATGCDVIVNALNPPYPLWRRDIPRTTAAVIHAARATGATVMIPGNVYNYGANMPHRLNEETPHEPTTLKGCLREEMEQTYARASDNSVRTIILRAGDFIEREKTGNWFDTYITDKLHAGRIMYPGPLDLVHAWAYLPDAARAMVGLASHRANFAPFECFNFAGYELTGQELVNALEHTCGHSLKVKGMPWPLIRALGLIMPQMREVSEMRYLWSTPHALEGGKLAAALPDFIPTPMNVALAEATGVEHSAMEQSSYQASTA